ncbi:Hypothetical protein LUCI_0164 [Lucifera butyrica]|uniref:Uncharacterized protein n=1 Tax=Lucifera butyrica TaxID=1351585 RepID=A0A498R749_9FIRM|nr:Hypothetical protein LUCI_0164 [Lucifera butyrica]
MEVRKKVILEYKNGVAMVSSQLRWDSHTNFSLLLQYCVLKFVVNDCKRNKKILDLKLTAGARLRSRVNYGSLS